MKYHATYKLNNSIKEKILDAVHQSIKDDAYYPRNGSAYGSHLLYSPETSRYSVKGLESAGYFSHPRHIPREILTWEWLEKLQIPVGWTTCAGNETRIHLLLNDYILLRMEGRRHGIRRYFRFLEKEVPVDVITYETQTPHESPFVWGVTPPWEAEDPLMRDADSLYEPPTIGEVIEARFF
jgi:hypothetical protein